MPTSFPRVSRNLSLLVVLTAIFPPTARAQDEGTGGVSAGAGQELLESIIVLPLKHAPFSFILTAEWTRPMKNGGTYTFVNARPIKRDAEGCI